MHKRKGGRGGYKKDDYDRFFDKRGGGGKHHYTRSDVHGTKPVKKRVITEEEGKRPKKVFRKERYPFFKKRRDEEEGRSPYLAVPEEGRSDYRKKKKKKQREASWKKAQRGEEIDKLQAGLTKLASTPDTGVVEIEQEVPVAEDYAPAEDAEGKVYHYGDKFKSDEDREHEFKSVVKAFDPIDRISLFCDDYVNAFLNTDGGYIYFGIEDDGTVVGLPLNRKERDLLRLRVDSYISNFKPQVDPYLFRMTFSKVVVFEGTKVLRPQLPPPSTRKRPHKRRPSRDFSQRATRQSSPESSAHYRPKVKNQAMSSLSRSERSSPQDRFLESLAEEEENSSSSFDDSQSDRGEEDGSGEEDNEEEENGEDNSKGDEDDEGDGDDDDDGGDSVSEGDVDNDDLDEDEDRKDEEDEEVEEVVVPKGKQQQKGKPKGKGTVRKLERKFESVKKIELKPAPEKKEEHKPEPGKKGPKVPETAGVKKEPSKPVVPRIKEMEGDKVIKGYRYLVEVAVGRGRAPVYFNSHGLAFFRLTGSIHQMKETMIEERKLMGRPPLAATAGSELVSIPPKATENVSIVTSNEVELISPRGISLAGPTDFIGRQKEISQVKEFIFDTSHMGNNVTILLYGSPVVGKSALARHLVRELSSVYNGAHYIINMKGVSSPYISILDAMIAVIRNAYPMRVLPESEGEITGIYQSCFNNNKCILLIENAGTAEQIQALVPKMSREKSVVLITSRRDLALDVVMEDTLSIRLSALEPKDAVLLVQTLVPQISAKQAQEISELCAYLPLPIRMVGSMIRRKTNVNVDSVIRRLKSDSIQFLQLLENMMGISAEEMYPESVKDYMFMLSVFPSGFDGPAAQAIFQKSYEETEDILGVLIEYSLIDFRLATGRYQMNDLVRLYCSKKLEERDKKRATATTTTPTTTTEQAPSIKDIQTRFINYYLTMLEELVKLKCQCDSSPTSREDLAPCMLCFLRERKNFEVSIKYAMGLKSYRLAWQLSKNMMLFVKDLNTLEHRKWDEVVNPVVENSGVKEVSKKEKENEKNNKSEKEEEDSPRIVVTNEGEKKAD